MRISLVLLCFFIPLHLWLSSAVIAEKGALDSRYIYDSAVPGKVLRFTSLEFKGLAADNRLLAGIFYIGRLLGAEGRQAAGADWDYFTSLVNSSVELDPYFFDTYYFASAMLAWNAARPEEAASILEKAAVYRPDDHRLVFSLGFIYYYFLNDNFKASEYIGKAAQTDGAPAFYANLAARLAFDSGSHETAAAFLISMIEQTQNESVRAMYEKRLRAIAGAVELEKALAEYRAETGKNAESLSELVSAGLIDAVPDDPYGGEYYITEEGRVYSTSGFASQGK